MTKKKLLCFLLLLGMLGSLVAMSACGSSNNASSSENVSASGGDNSVEDSSGGTSSGGSSSSKGNNTAGDDQLKTYSNDKIKKVTYDIPSANGAISVRDKGAVGNGVTDDTQAIKDALAEAKKTGKPVYFSKGNYLVTDTITINGQTMLGNTDSSWPKVEENNMPTLLIRHKKGPAVELKSGMIAGMNFQYDVQSGKNRQSYPETIAVTDSNPTIINSSIINPWYCIKVNNPNKRLENIRIENMVMRDLLHKGVYVDNTGKNVVLSNLETWNTSLDANDGNTFRNEGVCFHFLDNTDILAENLGSFQAGVTYLFEESNGRGTTAKLINCCSDYTMQGFNIQGKHNIDATGGNQWTHNNAIEVGQGDSKIVFRSMELRSNNAPALVVHNTSSKSSLEMISNTIRRTGNTSSPAVNLYSSKNVTLRGNAIIAASAPAPILWDLTELPEGITIVGNVITANSKAMPDSKLKNSVIENNAVGKYTNNY